MIEFFTKLQKKLTLFFTPTCNLCKEKRKDLVFWEQTGQVLCEKCTKKSLERTSTDNH